MDGITFDITGEDTGKEHPLQKDFERAGFRCFYVTPKKKDLIRNILEIYKIIKKGRYDAVHVHFEEWSFIYLMTAWLCGIKTRICHAHMAYRTQGRFLPHYIVFRFILNRCATLRLACSKDAGDSLYGKNPYVILHNAFDLNSCRFDPGIRAGKRKELGLKEEFVIGTVGRLSYQKDPFMTLDIFSEVVKVNPDSKLLLVGEGEMREAVVSRITELGLEDRVVLTGHREDAVQLMQAMDVFLLPSRFEGLGIVYIEAQAAGLKAFAKEGAVPAEACMAPGRMFFIPKKASPSEWAEKILSAGKRDGADISGPLSEKGYDITQERKKLHELYTGISEI